VARLHDRYVLFYPMRIVGAYFLVLIIALHVGQFEAWNPYYAVLMGVLLVHPHFVFLLTRLGAPDRARIEFVAFLVDSFFLGLVVHLNAFSLLPSLILITVALVNGLAVGGFKRMLYSGLALGFGIVAPMAFVGPNYDPKNAFGVNLACSVFLFVYFNFFAYSAFNRSALLVDSQHQLREQKATLEIEKMRSDRLLLHLVPAGLAGELEREGRLEPTVFDPVTMLAVRLDGFSAAVDAPAEQEPKEALELLTHCYQGFDAIVDRHGLEKLKTLGELYLAIAGLPRPEGARTAAEGAVAAVEAALEVRDFLADLAFRRQAAGQFIPEARIAVHSGKVLGGLVATARLSYDVWGTTVTTLLRLVAEAPPGQVAVSDATRFLRGSDAARAGRALDAPPDPTVWTGKTARS